MTDGFTPVMGDSRGADRPHSPAPWWSSLPCVARRFLAAAVADGYRKLAVEDQGRGLRIRVWLAGDSPLPRVLMLSEADNADVIAAWPEDLRVTIGLEGRSITSGRLL